MFNASQGTSIPLPAQDVEMSLEKAVEQLPSTHTPPYPPPQSTQVPDALAFIEEQRKTIESYMAQVSHRITLLRRHDLTIFSWRRIKQGCGKCIDKWPI